MKHIRKFILESKSTVETEFKVLKSLHKLGLVDYSELIVHKYIISGSTGDLDLQGTQITELPADLTVNGNLYLQGTPITSLPAGLTVNGNLYLEGTPIQSLPSDLKVGGYLDLTDTPIAEKYSRAQLKKMFPGVKGTIFII